MNSSWPLDHVSGNINNITCYNTIFETLSQLTKCLGSLAKPYSVLDPMKIHYNLGIKQMQFLSSKEKKVFTLLQKLAEHVFPQPEYRPQALHPTREQALCIYLSLYA